MLVIGLTGGIGAGKSTAARRFEDLGAEVIDVDSLGHLVLLPGGRAHDDVLDAFGTVDRRALGAIVFTDPTALAQLTGISHPAINAELAERLDALPPGSIVVLDMAILVESSLGRLADGRSYSMVIVVEAPEALRVARAVARGMKADDVRARMASQATDDERRAIADVVIVNDGDLDRLALDVNDVWSRLVAWS